MKITEKPLTSTVWGMIVLLAIVCLAQSVSLF